MVFAVVNGREGINGQLYKELATSIDLSGLLDLYEMVHVRASWAHAEMFNHDFRAQQRKQGG